MARPLSTRKTRPDDGPTLSRLERFLWGLSPSGVPILFTAILFTAILFTAILFTAILFTAILFTAILLPLTGSAAETSASHRQDARRPNVLLIAIDDLRNDLGVLGIAHARTPRLDDFARSARLFDHHYVQVPTCGASRCALLRGRYPNRPVHLNNNAIRDSQEEWEHDSLLMVFRRAGYRTRALGKVSHYPGGRTGKDWAEGKEELPDAWHRHDVPTGPWKTPLAVMHGYAEGAPRKPGESPAWEAFDGPDEAYPDAWVAAEAVKTLGQLASQDGPWFFAVGFFKPHLPFAAPRRWHDLHADGVAEPSPEATARRPWSSGWHGSGEFRGNYGHPEGIDPTTDREYARTLRRAYAASISYMDAQVGRVLEALRELELEEETIVVIWSDHGFLLGEHAIWGKHCLYEHALRSPLMIRVPGMAQPGVVSSAIVETVDIFPTMVELCDLPRPNHLDGTPLVRQIENPKAPSTKPALGFWTRGQRTIRDTQWRLIQQVAQGGEVTRNELFDMVNDPLELKNLASEKAEVIEELMAKFPRVDSE